MGRERESTIASYILCVCPSQNNIFTCCLTTTGFSHDIESPTPQANLNPTVSFRYHRKLVSEMWEEGPGVARLFERDIAYCLSCQTPRVLFNYSAGIHHSCLDNQCKSTVLLATSGLSHIVIFTNYSTQNLQQISRPSNNHFSMFVLVCLLCCGRGI